MKRIIIFVLTLVLISLCGCDTAKMEIVVDKEKVYFHSSQMTPKMTLVTEHSQEITDEELYTKLIDTINEKTINTIMCDCEPLYHILINDKYRFQFHSHGIAIFKHIGHNIKGMDYIGIVECNDDVLKEFFDILEKYNKSIS